MPNKTELTIVIVSYNTREWLSLTLKTLKEWYLDRTQLSVEVVVVDNASEDDSVAMVHDSFPWVTLLALPKNLGFAAGNNHALRQVKSPYVMLLNSDVELTAASQLDELVKYLEAHPKVGVIGPKLLLPSGKLDLAAHRGEPTLWAAATHFAGLEKLFPSSALFGQYHRQYLPLNEPHQIDAISGAAMVVRKQAFDQVGLLDEQFFMYAEDLDWCRRFRLAGWEVMYYPPVSLIHHKYKSGLNSANRDKARRTNDYFYDTMMQYYDKHYPTVPRWVRSLVKLGITIKKGVR